MVAEMLECCSARHDEETFIESLAKCSAFVRSCFTGSIYLEYEDLMGIGNTYNHLIFRFRITQYFVISITSSVCCGPGPAMLIEKAECGKYKMMMKYSNESLPAIPGWVGQRQPELNQHFLTRPHLMFGQKVKFEF